MDKKIRYGIIGVGAQGGAYAGFLTNQGGFAGMPVAPCPPHCALGALCDIDPAKEAMCKEKYPDIPFYSDWKEMIASGDVDAVITTVPHYLHTEMAIYCLEHGMNVLVEKPAGVYAKAVREMNECAQAHPEVAFGIMFNQRTNKLYQQIKEIIASGELGEIRRSNWIINSWWRPDSYYQQSDWRATWGGEGGGVLVNQAPHQLDLWQWMCGIPTKVYAKVICGAHRDIAVDNDVTIVTEYANGATGSFITCTHDAIGTDRLEIDLDAGKIVVEGSKTATVYRMKKSEPEMNATMDMMQVARLTSGNSAGGNELVETETFENMDGWGFQHTTVMENFALHILTGSPLLAPGTDGINGVNLANATLLSSWLGKEVELPVDEDLYLAELNKKIAEEGKFPTR
uniref:Gfo/Idh/MocA family protein n=1 Tax=Agathobacter sp. TaxID=2021311 RepID=UPI004056D435